MHKAPELKYSQEKILELKKILNGSSSAEINESFFTGIFTSSGNLKNDYLDVSDEVFSWVLDTEEEYELCRKIENMNIDLLLKCNILFTFGEKVKAIDKLEIFLGDKEGSKYAKMFFHLGFYYQECGNQENALKYYGKVEQDTDMILGNTNLYELARLNISSVDDTIEFAKQKLGNALNTKI